MFYGEQYEGRLSGSLEWRLARGETNKDMGQIHNKFQFSLNPQEIEDKTFLLKYSIVKDHYLRGSSVFEDSWESCTYESKSVFRKFEPDWKNYYLARLGKLKKYNFFILY